MADRPAYGPRMPSPEQLAALERFADGEVPSKPQTSNPVEPPPIVTSEQQTSKQVSPHDDEPVKQPKAKPANRRDATKAYRPEAGKKYRRMAHGETFGDAFKKVTLYLPKDVYKRFAVLCMNDEITVSDAVTRMVERTLARRSGASEEEK